MANGFKELKPFRYWCAKVLPLVYDDSLSYYELLGKVIESLNVTMEDVDLLNNYFDGIEVQEEIESTLDTMAQDGTLATLMQPYINAVVNPAAAQIPTYVSNWLDSNMAEAADAIDKSFTVADASPDAYRTGMMFRRLNSFNLLNDITKTSSVYNGVSYQWDTDTDTCTVSGTATALSYGTALFSETGKLIGYPYPCVPGDVVEFLIDSTDDNIWVNIFYYISGAWVQYSKINSDFVTAIPENAAGMLVRLEVNSGSEVDGTIKVWAAKVGTNETLYKGLPVLIPTEYDCNAVMQYMLEKFGGVQLCKGTYPISNAINMPANSTIRGLGGASMILQSQTQNAINMSTDCIVEDVWIKGPAENGIVMEDGTVDGIFIDGANGATYIYNPKVHNVVVSNFPGCGIEIRRSGGSPLNSPTITNCLIFYCFNGIRCSYTGEYARVANCNIWKCYHGIDNSSGNNKFIGCDISENFNGVIINASEDSSYVANAGHSMFVGCTVNHSQGLDNNGYAVIAHDLYNGTVFEGCQFWYGTIYHAGLNDTDSPSPLVFNGCEFRGDTDTSFVIYMATVIVNGSIVKNTLSNSVTDGTLIFNNTYYFDGTLIS